MFTGRISRLRMVVASGSALIAIGAFASACGNNGGADALHDNDDDDHDVIERSAASPTEKGVNPTGGNLFTPGVTAPAAPNVPPGQHPGINGVP